MLPTSAGAPRIPPCPRLEVLKRTTTLQALHLVEAGGWRLRLKPLAI